MNRLWIGRALILLLVAVAVGLVAVPIVKGQYLEAVALSGVVSVLAWFFVQGREARARKPSDQQESKEERER
ncbi:hypothetical protein JCM17960_08950 [Magnetospira thiophila]